MCITEYLSKRGSILGLGSKQYGKLVYHCEMLKDLLFDNGSQPVLTQVPRFIEERNSSEIIYNEILNYLNFNNELSQISHQIEQLVERYKYNWEAKRDQHSIRLEWIIILFFAIETKEIWMKMFIEKSFTSSVETKEN